MLLSTHDPDIGATDPDAGVGRASNNGDLVQDQCERSAIGGDQREAQVLIAESTMSTVTSRLSTDRPWWR